MTNRVSDAVDFAARSAARAAASRAAVPGNIPPPDAPKAPDAPKSPDHVFNKHGLKATGRDNWLSMDDAGNPKKYGYGVYTFEPAPSGGAATSILAGPTSIAPGETATIYALNDGRSYIIEKGA